LQRAAMLHERMQGLIHGRKGPPKLAMSSGMPRVSSPPLSAAVSPPPPLSWSQLATPPPLSSQHSIRGPSPSQHSTRGPSPRDHSARGPGRLLRLQALLRSADRVIIKGQSQSSPSRVGYGETVRVLLHNAIKHLKFGSQSTADATRQHHDVPKDVLLNSANRAVEKNLGSSTDLARLNALLDSARQGLHGGSQSTPTQPRRNSVDDSAQNAVVQAVDSPIGDCASLQPGGLVRSGLENALQTVRGTQWAWRHAGALGQGSTVRQALQDEMRRLRPKSKNFKKPSAG